jgi:hypothetical protein
LQDQGDQDNKDDYDAHCLFDEMLVQWLCTSQNQPIAGKHMSHHTIFDHKLYLEQSHAVSL